MGFVYFLLWALQCRHILFFFFGCTGFGFFLIKALNFVLLLFDLELESGGAGEGEGEGESGDLGFSKWLGSIQGKPGLWV